MVRPSDWVDLIVTRGTPAARAAKEATSTIPIVIAAVGEALGVVESLGRPGGNVTGLSAFTTELAGKRMEFAKELLPGTVRVGFFHNMSNPVAPPQWEQTQIAAWPQWVIHVAFVASVNRPHVRFASESDRIAAQQRNDAQGRYCCKKILGIWASNIHSKSAAHAQRWFKNPFVPIRLLRVSILQIPRDDFCNNIGTKRRKTMSALTSASGG
jgi:hypothetical protein